MGVLNRRDYETAIPQLEKKFSDLSKYITVSDGQIQIKIEDLYGKVATLTVDAEAIEARVDDAEDNIGDLEVTAQAITQALTTKVTIFTSQPSPPYEFGDLWDKGNDGLYRCIRSRSTGTYQSTDWAKEDKTALDEVATRTTMIRSISGGTLTCYSGGSKGVFVNANGTVDIVSLSWSGGEPTIGASVATYGATCVVGKTDGYHIEVDPISGLAVLDSSSRNVFRVFGYSGGARISVTNMKIFAASASEDAPTVDITGSGVYVLGVVNATGNGNIAGNLNTGGTLKVASSNLFAYDTATADNQTISASSFSQVPLTAPTKAGYTPVAITSAKVQNASSSGTGASNSTIFGFDMAPGSTSIEVRVGNTSSSAIKVKVTARILYVHNNIYTA